MEDTIPRTVKLPPRGELKRGSTVYASFRRNISSNYSTDVIAQIKAFEELMCLYEVDDPLSLEVELDADQIRKWPVDTAEEMLRNALKTAKFPPSDLFIKDCVKRAVALPIVDSSNVCAMAGHDDDEEDVE